MLIEWVWALGGVLVGALLTGLFLAARSRWRKPRATAAPSELDMLPIQALMDSIDDLAWIKDKESRFILVNRKFGEVFRVDPKSLVGKTDFDLSKPEMAEIYQAQDREVLRSCEPRRVEERISRSDGEIGWSETIKVPVINQHGEVVGTAGVARDITERRQAQAILEQRVADRTHEIASTLVELRRTQAELIQREKMASLGRMVAGIAHELNTPIGNGLIVASTMVEQTESLSKDVVTGLTRSRLEAFLADAREGADILVSTLRRAADLVSSFKHVAVDLTSANRRQFKLGDTVAEILFILSPVIRKTRHAVVCDIPPDIILDSYPGHLGQVLTNLVNNAIVHGFDGQEHGSIRIAAVWLDAATIELTVRDDGQGIAANHLAHVFDPFFTTKLGQGGSGLGLNIVYNLVHVALGGSIRVDSTEGQGACFTLTLPVVGPVTAASPAEPLTVQ